MPQENKYWVGQWPITLGRIRNFMRGFEGTPDDRLPFSCHSVRYLMAIIDGEIDPGEEPENAPWIDNPMSVLSASIPVASKPTVAPVSQPATVRQNAAPQEESPFNPAQMVSDSVSDMLSDKKDEDDLW